MANIIGIENMSEADIHREITKGGRFVQYIWCISLILITFKRSSDVYFIRADESAISKGLSYTLLTLFLGWWGIPWGPIYSLQCLGTNLSGGHNLTPAFLVSLNANMQEAGMEQYGAPVENVDKNQEQASVPVQANPTTTSSNRSGPVVRR